MPPKLIFLGTGASSGLPSFYCGCRGCQEALAVPFYRRTCCSLLIQNEANTLVDAPPDLRMQLVREKIDHLDGLFLTHSHFDHTGGLGELEFYVRLKRKDSLPAYMSAETEGWLNSAYDFMKDCLAVQSFSYPAHTIVDGISYSVLQAQHAPGTIGLLMQTSSGQRVAYLPDTGPLPPDTYHQLKEVDILILDATFWGENWLPEDHQSVESAVETGLALKAKRIYLTHLSMHYDQPVTNRDLELYLKQYGDHVHLAYDGLKIDLF
jgi:phosphoribosyl 1,2-cyclic phosphate phosphodiesterase